VKGGFLKTLFCLIRLKTRKLKASTLPYLEIIHSPVTVELWGVKINALLMILSLSVCMFPLSAQDKPTGLASVSGKGLSTTTGGEGGTTVTVSTWNDLKKYAEATAPHIILVKETIPAPSIGAIMRVTSNKTIVGLGDNATISYVHEQHNYT